MEQARCYGHAIVEHVKGERRLNASRPLAACGTPPPLDQAIKCDQFQRLPDGSWTTTTDVSLNYTDNGTKYQSNFGKRVTVNVAD